MGVGNGSGRRVPDVFLSASTSSFVEFVGLVAPELLPGRRVLPGVVGDGVGSHATTIVAVVCAGGVVMAGDRRATMGNVIAQRDIVKVFPADGFSLVGFAGTAGIGIEMTRLFQVELEHYEKLEGAMLSLDGKANRLAAMVRGNLGAAMQGLAAVPLFAGFDSVSGAGRVFSFDVTGGPYEESGYAAVGSGSVFAKGALKKRFRPGLGVDEVVRLVVEALYDAADEDSATGGPDVSRRIFPVVLTATGAGTRRLSVDAVGGVAAAVVGGRLGNPGG